MKCRPTNIGKWTAQSLSICGCWFLAVQTFRTVGNHTGSHICCNCCCCALTLRPTSIAKCRRISGNAWRIYATPVKTLVRSKFAKASKCRFLRKNEGNVMLTVEQLFEALSWNCDAPAQCISIIVSPPVYWKLPWKRFSWYVCWLPWCGRWEGDKSVRACRGCTPLQPFLYLPFLLQIWDRPMYADK